MKKAIIIFFFFLLSSFIILVETNWRTSATTKIRFTIDGTFGIDVHGTISGLKSSIYFNPENPKVSTIQASIRPATIQTGIRARDNHLRTSDYFDVEKFPLIQFTSKSFRQIGEYYVVEGNLTLKDVTKPVTIPFEFITSGDSAIFRGDFEINRLDYHVGEKSMAMGNKVNIHLDIPVSPIQ